MQLIGTPRTGAGLLSNSFKSVYKTSVSSVWRRRRPVSNNLQKPCPKGLGVRRIFPTKFFQQKNTTVYSRSESVSNNSLFKDRVNPPASPVGAKRRSRYRGPVAPGDGTGVKFFGKDSLADLTGATNSINSTNASNPTRCLYRSRS